MPLPMKQIFIIFLFVVLGCGTAVAQLCDFYMETTACVGQNVLMYPDCSATSFQWYVNDVYVGSSSGGVGMFSYQFTAPGTYTVAMDYPDGGGGGGNQQEPEPMERGPAMPGEVTRGWIEHTITILPSPNAPVLSASRSEVCDGDASVQVTVTNPQPLVTYSWSASPANTAFTGSGTSKTGTLSAAATIQVSATKDGCTVPATIAINYLTTNIQPSVTSDNNYHKRQIQLTYAGSNHGGAYYWQTSAEGTEVGSSLSSKTFVTEPGDYYLRRYSSQGSCWTNATAMLGVTINFQPPAAGSYVKQYLHPGYTIVDIRLPDRAHVFQYAKYYWVKGLNDATIISECPNGNCKVFKEGIHYLRGRDIVTGTWGPAAAVEVIMRPDADINAIHTKTFDGSSDELVVSELKIYFDEAGHQIQSQSKVLSENSVLATQTLNDRYDRVVGSTLPAPIQGGSFRYNSIFIQNQNGNAYTHTDFDSDTNRENPTPVGQQSAGTLGWYYSDQNPDVTIPQTDFPYNRTFFYEDGTGEVRKAIGVGNVFRERPGHETLSGTFPVYDELNDYMSKRIVALPGIGGDGSLRKESVQTIGRDENGRYVVSITDKSGKVVMSARQGMPDASKHMLAVTNTVTASADLANVNYQPLVYFYIWNEGPVTLSGSTDFLVEELVSGVKKSIPGETFADAQGNWPVGFYRMKINSGSVTLSYTNYYQDVSYQFYDDADRLRVSVSPNGYKAWKLDNTPFADIDKTTYIYNHRGWLLSMTEPDAGTTTYKYRRDGKIRFSQNSLQAGPSAHIGKFSYTHYDALGRPVESGEYIGSAYAFGDNLNAQLEFAAQVNFASADVKDWVRTHYDEPASDFATVTGLTVADYPQEFIRGAVSWTENQNIKTYYSYDELGRVTWMAQKPTGIARTFVLKYEYDFLGNVEKVANLAYVQGQVVEQFYHHYEYDADKRLSKAYTSTDGVNRKLRAHYIYYLHGPLKRLELGGGVQGIDFVYNIHGWLTQINHPNTLFDPGQDGTGENDFRKDAFGIIFEYYDEQPDPVSTVPSDEFDPLRIHHLPGAPHESVPSLAFGSNHEQLRNQLAQARVLAKDLATKRGETQLPVITEPEPVAYVPEYSEWNGIDIDINPFEEKSDQSISKSSLDFMVSPSSLTASMSSMPLPEVYTEGLVPDAIEFAALKDLYDSLAGSGWTNKTGWPAAGSWPASATSTQMDAWFGIVVTGGDITEINMSNNNLTGKIPASIGNLTKLKNLYLLTNKLNGRIPSSIGNLTALENLSLYNNMLTGSIPSTIGNMTALRQLQLFSNQLSGPIPSEIGNLPNLWMLRLYTNQLSGSLPSSMGSLSNLGYLEIAQNQFTGSIPATFSNLVNLLRIDLSNNQFTGNLPDVSGWTKVTTIEIGYTQMSGTLPAALGTLTTLTNLRIYNSNFSGELPYLGNLTNLQFLYLFGMANLTPAPIPDWVGNLGNLTHLMLMYSNRTGELPESMRNLKKLQSLQLMGNQLTGDIPSWIGEYADLTTLYLHINQFTGPIPRSIGNLTKLSRIYLHQNKLTGTIPSEIGNLPLLFELFLSDNQLTGAMPSSIGNLTNLVTTFFYNNKLTGPFPDVTNLTKLEKLDGTNNQFTSIPSSVLNLPKLIQLKFNYNKLTSIPNIAQAVNKANLSADLMYNYLDFTDLEPLFATVPHGIKSLTYGGQYVTNLNGGTTVPVPQGSTLILQAPPKGTYTTVTWERQTGPTTWTNVNSLNEDPTGQTFKLSNVTSAINGYVYRVRMSNTRVTGVQLTGDPLAVQVTESYVANDTDPANALYNGMITAMRWRTDKPHGLEGSDLNGMYRFQYDEKYQIKDANWATHNGINYTLQGNQYRVTNLTYDPNGNIQTLNRYDQNGVRTNQFAYTYAANKNQLQSVTGYANAYTYNSLGQMISVDKADKTNETAAAGNGDQTIEYDVTGKVTKVYGQSASQIGYYKMDGSGANSWGPMEAGTIYGPVVTTDHTGKANSAYLFDGMDDSIIIPDVADKTSFKATDFTVAVRVKKLVSINGSAHEALIGKWNHASNPGTNEWLLAIGNNGNANTAAISIETGTTRYQAVGTTVLQANTWYHVVGQREGDRLKIYVNGQLEGSVNIGIVSINNTSSQLFVARMLGGFMTNCAIADIQIFNRALQDDEIKALNKSNTGELLVSNLYDDRGFRLAKVNHTTSKTTWYIRDASGNTVNTYEQDNSTGTLNQTEIPVYASSKLGIYYPQQDGSMAYEITDHLGNVRALVREHVNIYQATMEDNGLAEYTNPRVQEMNYFSNIFETDVDDYHMNHTAPMPGVEESPSHAAYLYWVSGLTGNKSVGPAIALKVSAKDTVKLETWVRYEKKPTYTRNLTMLALAQMLGNSFAYQPGFEANTPAQTAAEFNDALGGVNFMNDGSVVDVPFAYLNYILFDEDMQWLDGGFRRIGEQAGFDLGEEGHPDKKPVRLAFDSPLVIPQNGYIYVWVSNESEATKVWFDDLTIVHTQAVVTQATDFGVWGDVLRELKSDNITYRHGYQGKFAEKDRETGWSQFKDRMYDEVIGRWLVVDPDRQYSSAYKAHGNNPISMIDPNGKWASQFGCYVHQTANQYGLWNFFKLSSPDLTPPQFNRNVLAFRKYLSILNKATEFADSKQFQDGLSAFRHAMRNETQTPLEGKDLANAFVRAQFDKAFALKAEGNEEQALFEFGVGLHVLQDATSPSHGGFQEWTGKEGLWKTVVHVFEELFYPGYKSNLQKVTNQALEWYKTESLPEGNLFDNIEIDE